MRISDWSSDVCSSDLGRRWLAPATAPAEGYDARRIALGVPEGAGELGVDKTLWLETNAVELNGVSFTKGCYVGQENTARMQLGRASGRGRGGLNVWISGGAYT